MPRLPSKRRCEDCLTGALVTLIGAASIAIGLIGFRNPSGTIVGLIGAGYLAFSAGLVLGGALVILGVWSGRRSVEMVGSCVLALMSLIHGTIILIESGPSGDQTGGRIAIIGTLAMLTVGLLRRQRGLTQRDLSRLETLHEERQA